MYELLKRMVLFFFCVLTMFPAYLNYRKDQPSFDITQIADKDAITVVNANVRGFDQADKGNTHWFVRAPLFYNTAKFDLIERGSFWVSETPEKMSKGWDAECYRVCSFLILAQKSDGTHLAVFNTHLDHLGRQARINGVKMIAERMKQYGDIPCILMGDMNFVAERGDAYSTALSYFDNAKYCTEDSDDGATWHGIGWKQVNSTEIDDYFFVSKTGVDVKQYRILRACYDGVYPSDHYPIQMKLTLGERAEKDNEAGVVEALPVEPVIVF